MSEIIVQTHTFLTLLGGGPTHFSHVNQALTLAPILVAADGGAQAALAAGHMPEAVIGDMDSVSDAARAQIDENRLHYIAEQNSTDFDKCLRSIEAPAILALGFTGGRLDHQLAACTTLINHADKRVFMLSEEDVCFVAPLTLALELPIGTRLSLYPMGPVTGTSTGLLYPLDGLALSPAGMVGTSNTVTGPVELRFDTPQMLVIVPRDQLQTVLGQLCTNPQ